MKQIVISLLSILLYAGSLLAGGYEVGDKARDFKLMNVDGKYVSLADYKDAKGFTKTGSSPWISNSRVKDIR